MNAWRETADKLNAAAKEFAIERRREIDATVSRMRVDAIAAEKKLEELARAGTGSWSTLNAALAETRANFDRANQATREAFKRATSPAHSPRTAGNAPNEEVAGRSPDDEHAVAAAACRERQAGQVA